MSVDPEGRVIETEHLGNTHLGGTSVDLLVQGPAGELWAYGTGWLSRSDGPGESWAHVPLEGTPLDFDIWRIGWALGEDMVTGPWAEPDSLHHYYLMPQRALSAAVGPDGVVWLGTTSGVVRYDGTTFETFDDPQSPQRRQVTALAVDTEGRVYASYIGIIADNTVGTFVSVLEDGRWSKVLHNMNGGDVDQLVASPLGGVWVNTLGFGLDWYVGAEPVGQYPEQPGGTEDLGFLTDGTPVGIGYDGLAWLTPSGEWVDISDGVVRGQLLSLDEDRIWTAWPWVGDGRFFRVGPGEVRQFSMVQAPRLFTGRPSVFASSAHATWVSGNHGLYRYKAGAWDAVATPPGSSHAYTMDVDDSGALWASLGRSIGRYDGSSWEVMDVPRANAQIISVPPQGQEVWIHVQNDVAQAYGLYHRGTDGTWQHYTSADIPMPNNRIAAIEAVKPGEVWYSAEGTLVHIKGGVVTDHSLTVGLTPSTSVAQIAVGPDEAVYAVLYGGTGNTGLAIFDSERWAFERSFGFVVPPPHVTMVGNVDIDSEGRVWVFTTWGISVYDGQTWRPLRIRGLEYEEHLNSLHAADDGSVWISAGGGHYRFTPDWTATKSDHTVPALVSRMRIVSAYPNPTALTVRLDIEGRGNAETTVEVFDMLGRRLSGGQWLAGSEIVVDLRDLPPGVYAIRSTVGTERDTRTVVKL